LPAGQRARVVVVEDEVRGPEQLDRLGGCLALVVQYLSLGLVPVLLREPLVALAHAVVGDQCRDAPIVECMDVVVTEVPGVGGEERVLVAHRRPLSIIGSSIACSEPEPTMSTWRKQIGPGRPANYATPKTVGIPKPSDNQPPA